MKHEDDDLLGRLAPAITPPVPPVSPARLAGVHAAARLAADAASAGRAAGDDPAAQVASLAGARSRRSFLSFGAAAAGGVAAGALGVFLLVDDDPAPAGPPTELAAVQTAPGVQASARMIDHTWGLEVLLDVDGLEPGTAYDLTFLAGDGRRVGAGGFVGTGAPMHCRNNGPILRADTTGFVVTGPDGAETLSATLT